MFTFWTRSQASSSVSRIESSSARRDAGVVVEDVDPAEPLRGGRVHRLHARPVGDVDLHRQGIARLGGDLLGRCAVDVGRADLGPLLGEDDRRLAAHAAAGARDDRDLAVEATHQASVARYTFFTSE